MKTNYRLKIKWKYGIIITHWLLSNIEKKSIKIIEKLFQKNNISTLVFDIYAHGKSEWKIEDLTLSNCYFQIQEMNNIFEKNNITCKYLYGTSFSTLAILKFWNNLKSITDIFLKTPVFDYLNKRLKELWEEKMKIWKEKWIIKVMDWFNSKADIYQKYDFILDCEKNFVNLLENNKKNLFLWAWIYDEEVDINELENLKNKNIILKKYNDWHRFSEENTKLFSEDIINYLKK